MLGAFLAFGVDTLVIVAALWYVGRLSGTIAGAVTVVVLLVFSLWVVGRWLRLRLTTQSEEDSGENTREVEETDPLDRLKQRYANGELSDAEFEERLDTLLDADRRAESANDTVAHRIERSRDSE
jgi:uncharacterized membrane protein